MSEKKSDFADSREILIEKWTALGLQMFHNIKRFEEHRDFEENHMLPFEVELELYQINEITRNLLVVILIPLVLYYGWTKSASDEMWIERRFASFFTFILLTWLSLSIIVPFSVVSILHSDLMLEIGERILSDYALAMAMVFVVIIIIQVLNYRGFFRKND